VKLKHKQDYGILVTFEPPLNRFPVSRTQERNSLLKNSTMLKGHDPPVHFRYRRYNLEMFKRLIRNQVGQLPFLLIKRPFILLILQFQHDNAIYWTAFSSSWIIKFSNTWSYQCFTTWIHAFCQQPLQSSITN